MRSGEVIWSAHLVKNRGFDREAQDKFSCALQCTEGYFRKFSTNRFINELIWITQVHRWTCMNYTCSWMNLYELQRFIYEPVWITKIHLWTCMNYTDSSMNAYMNYTVSLWTRIWITQIHLWTCVINIHVHIWVCVIYMSSSMNPCNSYMNVYELPRYIDERI